MASALGVLPGPTPDYPYTLAHLHAHAAFDDPDAEGLLQKPATHLHVPTARVPLESVLWHLIAEWGVRPKTGDWKQVLRESVAGYEERRTAP